MKGEYDTFVKLSLRIDKAENPSDKLLNQKVVLSSLEWGEKIAISDVKNVADRIKKLTEQLDSISTPVPSTEVELNYDFTGDNDDGDYSDDSVELAGGELDLYEA